MANLDFYATREDQLALLEFVLKDARCRVFESYSRFDMELREFKRPAEIDQAYNLATCGSKPPNHTALLQLLAPDVSTNVNIRRIELDKRRVKEGSFRFCLEGWGLIQLYLGSVGHLKISCSHFGHNSEARARNWEPNLIQSLGPVDAWDWKELEHASRRIRYHISRRLSQAKTGSRPVLRDAETSRGAGYELVG